MTDPRLTRRAVVGAALLATAGCGNAAREGGGPRRTGQGGSPADPSTRSVVSKAPGALKDPLLSPDVLVGPGKRTISASAIEKMRRLPGVVAVEPISMGSFFVDEQEITYAAVNPSTFRRYTDSGTAQTVGVWRRVADGEIAVQPSLSKKLQSKDGFIKLGNGAEARSIHIGAYAQLLNPLWAKQIDAVVNYKWAGALGLPKDNALLVSFGERDPHQLRKQLQGLAGTSSVQFLGKELDPSVAQTVVLTGGGAVANKVGSFSYKPIGGGRVAPDPKWVSTYIRTEQMPIIGSVTGNKVMLPQLRGALTEIQRSGLSKEIYQYGGCYVPRFIAGTNTLSFHSFGTAIDLNVPDNQRGTAGKMNRVVVGIFSHWGFEWGGNWRYTDPMHFELHQLTKGS